MNTLLLKPHKLFAYLALVILIAQYSQSWILGDTATEIPLHDTYLVINIKHIAVLYCIVILVFSFIYKIGEKYGLIYSRGITVSHAFSFILLIILSIYNIGLPPKRYYNFDNFDALNMSAYLNRFVTFLIFINFALFILNLVLGFLDRNK